MTEKASDVVESTKRIVEAYLVTCARLGDRVAKEQLVTRYQKKFLRHAYRLLGEAEQSRDAVQDGWVEILRGLPKLKDDGAFPAWAFRIITRKCAKHIAGLQKARATLETVSGEPMTSVSEPSAPSCAHANGAASARQATIIHIERSRCFMGCVLSNVVGQGGALCAICGHESTVHRLHGLHGSERDQSTNYTNGTNVARGRRERLGGF